MQFSIGKEQALGLVSSPSAARVGGNLPSLGSPGCCQGLQLPEMRLSCR